MRISRHLRHLGQAGFTLIEVMIALLIGIIGIVVMMQTFAVSEGFKRTATSGTDAQINGGVALYMLEREIRNAGYGMNALMQMGCPSVRLWNSATGTGLDLQFYPFEINPAGVPAGDANTDVLLVSYGNASSFVAGVPADQAPQATATAITPFTVTNWDGFHNGDLFVSVMPGAGPGGTASCVMHEATATSPASGNCGGGVPPGGISVVSHGAGAYKSAAAACATVSPTHNSGTGITLSGGGVVPVVHQSGGGQIFNMGVPSVKVYAIRNGSLTFCDWIASDCTSAANFAVLVNDIVSLRAVYGMNLTPAPPTALAGDGIVTPSIAPIAGGNVFLPSRVMAVTLELTARSSLKEKPSAGSGTICDATPVKSRPDRSQDWIYQVGPPAAPIDLSTVSADWACYRYKLFQTSIPIRNTIWRP
jgi:type IV pilus assembly protein PilW